MYDYIFYKPYFMLNDVWTLNNENSIYHQDLFIYINQWVGIEGSYYKQWG